MKAKCVLGACTNARCGRFPNPSTSDLVARADYVVAITRSAGPKCDHEYVLSTTRTWQKPGICVSSLCCMRVPIHPGSRTHQTRRRHHRSPRLSTAFAQCLPHSPKSRPTQSITRADSRSSHPTPHTQHSTPAAAIACRRERKSSAPRARL